MHIVFLKILVHSFKTKKMEALVLLCRWCSRKFNCTSSRYKHEDRFHVKEKEVNAETYFEPDSSLFVKCTICSIYTTRDKYDIQDHESSEHHLRKVPKQKAQNQRLTGSLSSIGETSSQLLQPLPLPPRRHEVVDTSYPRFIAQTGTSAAPAAGAAAVAAAPAAAEPAAETKVAAVDPGFSNVLEDPNYVFMPDGNSSDLLHLF
jgi:hypothetical protein